MPPRAFARPQNAPPTSLLPVPPLRMRASERQSLAPPPSLQAWTAPPSAAADSPQPAGFPRSRFSSFSTMPGASFSGPAGPVQPMPQWQASPALTAASPISIQPYSPVIVAQATVQRAPSPAVSKAPSRRLPGSALRRQISRQSTTSSVWSSESGETQRVSVAGRSIRTGRSSLTGAAPTSIGRRESISASSISSYQSGRVSLFRRRLSLATTTTKRHSVRSKLSSGPPSAAASITRKRASWELLEETEEIEQRKAAALLRARMRRNRSSSSAESAV